MTLNGMEIGDRNQENLQQRFL